MDGFSFEQLRVYQASLSLVSKVYQLTRCFPSEEKYALCQQLQRAIVSVPSKIAEGSGRNSYKEKIRFLEIAYGSLMEAYCQIQVAERIGYIQSETVLYIRDNFMDVSRLLNGLKRSFESQSTTTL